MNTIEAIETLESMIERMDVRQYWVLYASKTCAILSELITKDDLEAIYWFGVRERGVEVWIEAGEVGDGLARFALKVEFCRYECALDGEQRLMVFIDWFKRFDELMKAIKGGIE